MSSPNDDTIPSFQPSVIWIPPAVNHLKVLPAEVIARVAVVTGHFQRKGSVVPDIFQFIDRQQGQHVADLVPVAMADEGNFSLADKTGGIVSKMGPNKVLQFGPFSQNGTDGWQFYHSIFELADHRFIGVGHGLKEHATGRRRISIAVEIDTEAE